MIDYSKYKLVVSGDIAELIYNPNPVNFETDREVMTELNIKASRSRLKRIINSNSGQWYDEVNKRFFRPLFLTLTFKDGTVSVKDANIQFTDFIRRLNMDFFNSKKRVIKYTCVIEFQYKRGETYGIEAPVHYHVLFYNIPFIDNIYDRILKVWGKGFTIISAIHDVRNVGAYVTKYMSKQTRDDRLRGKKMYFNSRGLKRPIKIDDDLKIFDVMTLFPENSLIYDFEREDGFMYARHFIRGSVLKSLTFSQAVNIINNEGMSAIEVLPSVRASRQLPLFPLLFDKRV